jgi:hypothetical protein
MIKATDLKLGNWVKADNPEYFNAKYNGSMVCVDIDEYQDIYFNENLYSPIPLTPEILKQAGFEKQRSSDNVLDNYFIGENPITHDWIMSLQWIDGREAPFYKNGYHQIKYLHQLQNLFYSLAGIELEINLSEPIENNL